MSETPAIKMIRSVQRAQAISEKRITLLQALQYDERDSTLDTLRASARDASHDDDATCCDSSMRMYHAR